MIDETPGAQPPEEQELLTSLPAGYMQIWDRLFTRFDAQGAELPGVTISVVAALTLCEDPDDSPEHAAVEAIRPYAKDQAYRAVMALLDLYAKAEQLAAQEVRP